MEDLKKIINEVIGKNDKEWEKSVCEIVKKIIDLPEGVDTTIANLIEYNPQKEMVDPLTQGKIANLVENVCNKMNIELVPTEDSLGGLAYYYHFKKVINYSQKELEGFFYYTMNENEREKINKLGMSDIISQMSSYYNEIKYIENVGYIIIGEGHLILDDGTEPRHYFATILKTEEEAKKEIMKRYNKSDDEIDEKEKKEWQKFIDECKEQASIKTLIEDMNMSKLGESGFLDVLKVENINNYSKDTRIYLKNPDDPAKIICIWFGNSYGEQKDFYYNINLINLEVVKINDLNVFLQKEKFYYKGYELSFEDDRDTWELWINIIGNYDFDIKDRTINAGTMDNPDEIGALERAMAVIDEALLKNKSKTKKDVFIDAMRLPDNINSLSRKEQNRILCENIRDINSKLGNSINDLEYTLNREQRTIKTNTMKIINNKEFIEAYNQIIDLVDKKDDTAELSNAEKVEVFTLIRMLYNNLLIEFEDEKLDDILYEKGNKYYLGKDVEKDYKKAFDIFKDLADNKEHLKSMEVLCYMYFYGQGIDVNYELARKYCEIVEQKNSNCDKNILQFLGEMYFDGLGVEADYSKAKVYFEKSLRDKYDDTYYKLGLLNSGNYGLPKDEEKAKEYFNKVEKDLLRAIIYLLIATKPEEEQNLEGVYNYIGNSRKEYNNFFTNSMPFDHIATINYKKVAYLNDEDYDNLVKNVKEKLECCLHNDVNIEKGLFPFTSEDDVDVYVDTIVNCKK